jgi:hypothetical protein
MKADFLSPRAGMGGAFFVDGFQRPEPELVEAVRQGIEARLVAIGRRLPDVDIEHDCLRYVEASIEAGNR